MSHALLAIISVFASDYATATDSLQWYATTVFPSARICSGNSYTVLNSLNQCFMKKKNTYTGNTITTFAYPSADCTGTQQVVTTTTTGCKIGTAAPCPDGHCSYRISKPSISSDKPPCRGMPYPMRAAYVSTDCSGPPSNVQPFSCTKRDDGRSDNTICLLGQPQQCTYANSDCTGDSECSLLPASDGAECAAGAQGSQRVFCPTDNNPNPLHCVVFTAATTTSPAITTSPPKKSPDPPTKVNAGAVAAGILVPLIVLAIVGGIIYFLIRKKQPGSTAQEEEDSDYSTLI